MTEQGLVELEGVAVKSDEPNIGYLSGGVAQGRDGDARRSVGRKAVGAGGDRRECDRFRAEFVGNLQATSVARREHSVLSGVSASPNGPDGVDDPSGGEGEAARCDRISGIASTDLCAGRSQLCSAGCAVDGTVHATATGEPGVRGVHNGINLLLGDVPLHRSEPSVGTAFALAV